MKNLEKTRKEIDNIDIELIKLFEYRMNLVNDVIEYKIENNMEILDTSRENFILEKNKEILVNKEYSSYLEELFKCIMKVSKEMQNNILENDKNE